MSGVFKPARGKPPMYGGFYDLLEPPFDLTPNPRFLFLTPRQREALSNLQHGLSTSRGFTLLVGEAGTGKTTLVRTALSMASDSMSRYVLISNPTLDRAEFYEYLVRGFGLSSAALQSKTAFLAELQLDVEARFAAGGLTGIIIDEAQSLSPELLEEIRLLGNIETTSTKLLNIVISGQPEFAARLKEPSLRQLKQRITLRCELSPLSLDETAAYIAGRLRIAGAAPEHVFTHEAVTAIHRGSQGIPRTINVLCDNALISGFALGAKPIPAHVIEDVCRDFDIDPAHLAPLTPISIDAPATPAAAAATIAAEATPPAAPSAEAAAASVPRAPGSKVDGPAVAPSTEHARTEHFRSAQARHEHPRTAATTSKPAPPRVKEREMFASAAPKKKSRFSFFTDLFSS